MRILELQEYAKDNGFDSIKFKFKTPFGFKTGHWIDAYFGIFHIQGMPDDKFMIVQQWREMVGDEIEFAVDETKP